MIDKTYKRSFFARIAFGIFVVALAFCLVSVALNDGKYKASAYTTYENNINFQFSKYYRLNYFCYTTNVNYPLGGSSWLVDTLTFIYTGTEYIIRGANDRTLTPFDFDNDGVFDYYAYTSVMSNNLRGVLCYLDYNSDFYYYSDMTLLSASYEFVSVSSGDFIGSSFLSSSDFLTDNLWHFTYTFDKTVYQMYCCVPDGLIYDEPLYFSSSDPTITESVTDVWTSIFNWLTTSVNSLLSILYVNGELTILGVLVVMSLGISIFFLLLAVVSNFFHLRN